MREVKYTKEIGDYDYYNPYTLTTLYVEQTFGGNISTINLTNDSTTDEAQYSFDGATLHGEVGPGESVKVNVKQKGSIYVKGDAGGDVLRIWSYVDVSASNVNATIAFAPLGVVNKTYEDTLTAGVSPLIIDFNTDAGRNSKEGWITCDSNSMLVAFTRDGVTFGDDWTMTSGENTNLANFDIDQLRLTRIAADADYRIVLI